MTTKTVLQLDDEGYFVGITQADESPLEPGVWLLPGGCVDAPAPEMPDGFLARWNGAGFDLEAIHAPEPEPEPSLEGRRLSVWGQIKTKRDHLKSSGVKVGTHWFHSDADSRIQQLGLVIMGASIPEGLMWKALGDEMVAMTPTLAGEIFAATAAWDGLLFATAEAHRAAVMESAEPEDYDWQAGWPLGYGE